MGSHSAIAAGPEAATTAPSATAAVSASHNGVSFSTERRCIGESPTRYVNGLSRTAATCSGAKASGRASTAKPRADPPRRRTTLGPGHRALRMLERVGSRQDEHRVTDGAGQQLAVDRVGGVEVATTDQRQRPGHRSPFTLRAPPGRCCRATPATQDRSGRVSVVRPKRSMLRMMSPARDRARQVTARHEAVSPSAARAAGSARWRRPPDGEGCGRGREAVRRAPAAAAAHPAHGPDR